MTIAALLLREECSTSLSSIVEKSQTKKPPFLEYDLILNNNHLDLILTSNNERILKSTSSDEGFESDIDSVSIVSSDESFTSANLPEGGVKSEVDSANGSSSSDSDTDSKNDEGTLTKASQKLTNAVKETYDLVKCICYTDVKFPDILVFVIQNVTYVFKFSNLNSLQNFYTNFTALKAVANQKVYNKNFPAKFNLLQRTDNNGVTHIEITRESGVYARDEGPSSIISIIAPDNPHDKSKPDDKSKNPNSRQRTESKILGAGDGTLVKEPEPQDGTLRKVWNSADDLLDSPKRPERRKKPKGKAPPPPVQLNDQKSVYSGQFVRVNVNFDILKDEKNRLIIKSACDEPHPRKLQHKLAVPKPNFLKAKPAVPEVRRETSTLNRNRLVAETSWTNSMPKALKKPRSKSETRQFTPMAYRYIDTTQNYPHSYSLAPVTYFSQSTGYTSGFSSLKTGSSHLNNRLFGLSSKLKDFTGHEAKHDDKWNGNEGGNGGNLKSVIKKEDTKKKNDKKVTFSAYTTVQVV